MEIGAKNTTQPGEKTSLGKESVLGPSFKDSQLPSKDLLFGTEVGQKRRTPFSIECTFVPPTVRGFFFSLYFFPWKREDRKIAVCKVVESVVLKRDGENRLLATE